LCESKLKACVLKSSTLKIQIIVIPKVSLQENS